MAETRNRRIEPALAKERRDNARRYWEGKLAVTDTKGEEILKDIVAEQVREIAKYRSQLSIARAALEGIRKLAERESESAEVNVRSKPSIRPVSSASRMHKADRIASISAEALKITDPPKESKGVLQSADERNLYGEFRAMVYDDAFHMLKKGAPGLSEATRMVIASAIALRVYTHFQSEFIIAPKDTP